MANFEDHKEVLKILKDVQSADKDNRDKVREVGHFLNKPDGQWDIEIVNKMSGRPRFTFDQCNDIVDDIAGEMDRADFVVKVEPAGGDATVDIAKTYNGLIRNIQNISNAKHVYNQAGRNMSGAGLAGWRVKHRWGETDSFEQDLYVDPINNYVDRVWFLPHESQTGEDADGCFILTNMDTNKYKEDFPEASKMGVGQERASTVYFDKNDTILVGEFIYKKMVSRELVLMSDNSVYVDDDKFKSVVDELKAQGITEKKRRIRKMSEIKTRLFDGGGWLNDEEDTVFELLPVIPTYGNFNITEDGKIIYWGAVTKKMDAQRAYNYAESRKIEETALAPREKTYMTREQAANDLATLATQNTNSDPVQLYTHTDGQNPPFKMAGSQINQGLEVTSNSALQNLRSGVSTQPNQPLGLMSGVAVKLNQDKDDTKNVKYFTSQEVAINHTCKILVEAIPKVYDTRRQVRLIGVDGSSEMVMLHDVIFDDETQKSVELNDIGQGKYDVTCSMGPAFQSKQAETVAAFNEIASIDPTILQSGKDIWLKNMNAPDMDAMAERARTQLFNEGAIPESQMTQEEKEQLAQLQQQQAQNPQQPDALMVAAQAEMTKAQNQTRETDLKTQIASQKIQNDRLKLQLDVQKQETDRQKLEFDAISTQSKLQADILSTNTKTLETLQNVIVKASQDGGIIGPNLIEAFIDQSNIVNETQDNL